MPRNFRSFPFIVLFLAACSNGAGEEETNISLESLTTKRNAVIVLVQAEVCWPCNRFYWELYPMAQQDTSFDYIWLGRKLREADRKQLHDYVGHRWGGNIRYVEDTELYRKLKSAAPSEGHLLLLLHGGEQRYFKGHKDYQQLKKSLQERNN